MHYRDGLDFFRDTALAWLLLLLLSSLWGTSFLLIALAIQSLSPASVVMIRLSLGAVVLLLALRLSRQQLPRRSRDWMQFATLALIGNVLPFLLIAWGQQYITSGTAGMLMAVMPLATLVIAHFVLPGEPLTPSRLAGVVLGAGGVWLLLDPDSSGHPRELIGAIAVFSAALLYAVNAVLAKRLPQRAPRVTATGVVLCATALAIPITWLAPSSDLPLHTSAIAAVIWLGTGATGLATLVYFELIHRAGATFLANINYLIPVIALLCGAWILDEPLQASNLLALTLILVGIAISRWRRTP